jgi:NHL repeat
MVSKIAEFYGEENNPLLAPRGVFLHGNTLVVSDTGQNRVFIWYNFDFQKYQSPSVVLGQKDNSQKERNAGHSVSAASLQYPSGIWTDGNQLIVADAWNHRVLIWNQMPSQNFQEASIVVGQRDFNSNQPNIDGIGKNPGQNTLNWPYGVFSNGTSLWIADTGNRRVLYFDKIPTTNYTKASAVIGQENFNTKEYDNNNAIWPYSVKIDYKGSMLITDTQYYRVLYWEEWTKSLNNPPDIIIGQKSMEDSGQNQYQLKPNAHTLNWVYDACFYGNGIVVADTGNSRLIVHEQIPTSSNAPAHSQIGQPNFETHGESSLSMKSTVTNEMYWPFSVNASQDLLISADTGNHRILFYK